MNICENCGIEHNGMYGSGRFCSSKCSHSYSAVTNNKKRIKNIKIASKISIENGTHNGFSGNGNIVESAWDKELTNMGFKTVRNKPINCDLIKNNNHFYRIDILVNDIIDLEIDGNTFHKDSDKDNKRDDYLKAQGFIVYRVPYVNPKRSREEFLKQVSDFVDWYNHNIKNTA